MSELINQAVVASYSSHDGAEQAVHLLQSSGLPMNHLSIIGRDWQVREDVQGFYHPGDALKEDTKQGAWAGGLVGLFIGVGMFILPIAGPIMVLGPLGGIIAAAVTGAGLGALSSSLMALGIPEDQAIKYQERIGAGEFVVVVHGPPAEAIRAQEVLQATATTSLATHGMAA